MKIGGIIIVLAIVFSLNGYVIARGWQALPSASTLRPVYLATTIALLFAMFAGMFFGNSLPQGVAKAISFVGFTYIVIFIYLFFSFLFVDILR
ncbi:MAG: hypothetical protein Q8904_10110, partial [Bacteroidota bacterium]|nr:hypothetical protein [Bacteroidota bacterium]